MTEFSLIDLSEIIDKRAQESVEISYTARLLSKGTHKCAEKLGEEAVETIIAAVSGDGEELKKEAADMLYHLLVLLKSEGVQLNDVLQELQSRTSQSGLEEKALRRAVNA